MTTSEPGVCPVILTDDAAARVMDQLMEDGDPASFLRIYVQGGGCSGFAYGMTIDTAAGADDLRWEVKGVAVVIDALSLQYLVGAEVDYQETVRERGFVFRNPNATTTCGCGSSFSIG